jgi:hypothetical protein
MILKWLHFEAVQVCQHTEFITAQQPSLGTTFYSLHVAAAAKVADEATTNVPKNSAEIVGVDSIILCYSNRG